MSTNVSKNRVEFYSLAEDKDVIKSNLLNNDVVYELVLGEGNTDGDFDKHFFNTLFIDTTQLEDKTYITMDTEIIEAKSTKVKCIAIIMDIFTAPSNILLTDNEQEKFYKLGYKGNRIDVLLDAIKRSISDLDIGIGQVTLAPTNAVRIVRPTDKFYGKRMILHVYDF